jgi:hypothetical protein
MVSQADEATLRRLGGAGDVPVGHSRRVWDLLREARDLQVPLLGTARRSPPVTLHPSAAAFSLDVRRAGGGLDVHPHVEVDGHQVPLASALLVGRPAHGLAWWDDAAAAPSRRAEAGPPRLQLAPLSAPVDDAPRAFLDRKPVRGLLA